MDPDYTYSSSSYFHPPSRSARSLPKINIVFDESGNDRKKKKNNHTQTSFRQKRGNPKNQSTPEEVMAEEEDPIPPHINHPFTLNVIPRCDVEDNSMIPAVCGPYFFVEVRPRNFRSKNPFSLHPVSGGAHSGFEKRTKIDISDLVTANPFASSFSSSSSGTPIEFGPQLMTDDWADKIKPPTTLPLPSSSSSSSSFTCSTTEEKKKSKKPNDHHDEPIGSTTTLEPILDVDLRDLDPVPTASSLVISTTASSSLSSSSSSSSSLSSSSFHHDSKYSDVSDESMGTASENIFHPGQSSSSSSSSSNPGRTHSSSHASRNDDPDAEDKKVTQLLKKQMQQHAFDEKAKKVARTCFKKWTQMNPNIVAQRDAIPQPPRTIRESVTLGLTSFYAPGLHEAAAEGKGFLMESERISMDFIELGNPNPHERWTFGLAPPIVLTPDGQIDEKNCFFFFTIVGPSRLGKSTWAAEYVERYLRTFPDYHVIVLRGYTREDVWDDKKRWNPYNENKPGRYQVKLYTGCNDGDRAVVYKNTLVVFDDIDNIPKDDKYVYECRDWIATNGGKSNTSCLNVIHNLYPQSFPPMTVTRNESHGFCFFNNSDPTHMDKWLSTTRFPKKQILQFFYGPTQPRWMCFFKPTIRSPLMAMTERDFFLF